MNDRPTRRILGPFNRVEGDLEVTFEVADGHITQAWVNSPLYRGFEQILRGKPPMDALVYTPRICGICSVSQSVAAARALAACAGLQSTANGVLATNLILATENLADHLTHFYLFFMPDFARKHYHKQLWFDDIAARFKAQTGSAASEVLKARAELLHITGLLAGKWPHSMAIQPGGTTRPLEAQEKVRLLTLISAFRQFLQNTLFHDTLEQVSALQNSEQLDAWADAHAESDFGRFLQLARLLQLQSSGHTSNHFMSYGAYENSQGDKHKGAHLFARGVWLQGKALPLDGELIREDVSHSRLNKQNSAKHPYQGSTIIDANEDSGYSWCKAPRLDGQVIEVGAIARQMVDGHPLLRDLVTRDGANVMSRVVARLLELALVTPAMENWIRRLKPAQAFCHQAELPDDSQGAGMVGAARGSLGHWLRIKDGRILNYQIIAPTTWNFSPRDSADQPGALEMALQGTPVGDDAQTAVIIQHIIRSFNPCMVCTVH